jgi:eukaryotic-like serine/threonine-protein kinase
MSAVKFLGKYYLQEKIATSASSTLYRAMQIGPEGFERMVLVHRLRDEVARDEGVRRQLSDLIELRRTLSHPNLTRVLDFSNVRDEWLFVREYVHGTSLRMVLSRLTQQRQTLSLEESLFVAQQMLRALAALELYNEAHGTSLIHGLVSPNNVLVGYGGEIKLIGLGTGTLFQVKDSGSVDINQLPYQSPDQLQGKPLDQRSDVFSVGAVLAEMVAGKALFLGRNDEETASRIAAGLPLKQAEDRGIERRDVAQLLTRALEVRRDWRLLGAAEMLDGIAELAPQMDPAETRGRLVERIELLFGPDIERERSRVAEEHRTVAKLLGSEPPPPEEMFFRTGLGPETMVAEPAAAAPGAPEKIRPSRQQYGRETEMLIGSIGADDTIQTGRELSALLANDDVSTMDTPAGAAAPGAGPDPLFRGVAPARIDPGNLPDRPLGAREGTPESGAGEPQGAGLVFGHELASMLRSPEAARGVEAPAAERAVPAGSDRPPGAASSATPVPEKRPSISLRQPQAVRPEWQRATEVASAGRALPPPRTVALAAAALIAVLIALALWLWA